MAFPSPVAILIYLSPQVTDEQLRQAKFRFPHNPPQTKEAYFYRQMFCNHFPGEAAQKTVPGISNLGSTLHLGCFLFRQPFCSTCLALKKSSI